METIRKSDFVLRAAKEACIDKDEAAVCINTLIDIIKNGVNREGSVLLYNFGTLEKKRKAERPGRNPATGEKMMLPERRVVVFKVSRNFRRELDRKAGEHL